MKTALVCIAATALTVFAAASKAPVERSDSEITRVFKEKLAKSKLAVNGFAISVKNGVATLTGRTDIVQHKGTATRMAKSAGAREVRNQIEVSATARRKAADQLAGGAAHRAADKTKPPVEASPGAAKPASAAPATPAAAAETPLAPPPVRRAVIKHQ